MKLYYDPAAKTEKTDGLDSLRTPSKIGEEVAFDVGIEAVESRTMYERFD